MHEVLLQSLKCYDTQDWDGVDECRLEVMVDGTFRETLKQHMRDAQKWRLMKTYGFETQVTLKLWDEDRLSSDQCLGAIVIEADTPDTGTALFAHKGAHYKLWYQVGEAAHEPEKSKDSVEDVLKAFEQSDKLGMWRNLAKDDVIADVREKAEDPNKVKQGILPFCGPASIIFELISRDPSRYVRICQSLYENGTFHGRTKTISPSRDLRNSHPRSGISVADWMLLATLRDARNQIFPMSADMRALALDLSCMTMPWDMKSWIFELLNFDETIYTPTYLYGDLNAIREAHAVKTGGGVAFLMIDMAMLIDPSDSAMPRPNHWVPYVGRLQIEEAAPGDDTGGRVGFDCYSWGSTRHVELDTVAFEKYLWGVVSGI